MPWRRTAAKSTRPAARTSPAPYLLRRVVVGTPRPGRRRLPSRGGGAAHRPGCHPPAGGGGAAHRRGCPPPPVEAVDAVAERLAELMAAEEVAPPPPAGRTD